MDVKNKKKEDLGSSIELNLYKKIQENYSPETIKSLVESLKKDFEKNLLVLLDNFEKEKDYIPTSIFNKELTPLESIVKFLKENKNNSYKNISSLIKRDERNIWHTYNVAKTKFKQKFKDDISCYKIPISIFSNRKLSVQENLVFYLKKEFKLTYHEIAVILCRDDRTVWTVYKKAKEKNESK